ncbi:hypothetical protein BGW38_009167 [Lunasporangiospora selenospora]|uniref:Uncharacterized protein n=1 Tax=Lunasporangiospora selenospora TaxID=979761 RepID=A0A9P6FY60_9FUNG|nr:hypothetical protein BGW38_009167 [Lunasporangiospora selenospora]
MDRFSQTSGSANTSKPRPRRHSHEVGTHHPDTDRFTRKVRKDTEAIGASLESDTSITGNTTAAKSSRDLSKSHSASSKEKTSSTINKAPSQRQDQDQTPSTGSRFGQSSVAFDPKDPDQPQQYEGAEPDDDEDRDMSQCNMYDNAQYN